ncbi:MAG: hypothetical protein HYX78_13145 [Armatimonadetes bacterium]|nr:hypothetical protein [Armatimonadota bacterium]
MRERLIDTLDSVGKPTELYRSPDGTQVLVLPYGGRVLGLFAPGSDENFYWTNAALESPDSARQFYASDQWHNSGGDRTWLSPEVDLFFPNFPRLDTYFQQRSLDPGNYQVVRSADGFKLVNRLTVNLSRLKEDVELEITKSIGPAPNPLRHERGIDLGNVQYAGYTQYTSLDLLKGDPQGKAQIGLWNLVQMPHPGDLVVPTYSRAEPNIYFGTVGTIGTEDTVISDRLFRYRMRQQGEHKLAIRAAVTTGRVGYIYQTGDKWALIIRNFWVNPSGEYIDVPWKETDYFGYSTQACNINSGLGQFNELEYHIPAIGCGTGCARCDDEAQVWAFRGDKGAVERVARILLSPEV